MEEIPYEGTEVDKETMINELMNFFRINRKLRNNFFITNF